MMDRTSIQSLFEAVDKNSKGYLTLSEFEKIGKDYNLTSSDIRQIFISLDTNKDGKVEQSEFVESFHLFSEKLHQNEVDFESGINVIEDDSNNKSNSSLDNLPKHSRGQHNEDSVNKTSTPKRPSIKNIISRKLKNKNQKDNNNKIEDDSILQRQWDEFTRKNDKDIYALPNYSSLCQLYKDTVSAGNTELVRNFESVISTMVNEMIGLQKGVENLEMSLEKATEKSQQQLSMLEEEMEAQILSKEEKVREEERKVAEEKQNNLKHQYQKEIIGLNESMKKLKQVDTKLSRHNPYEKEVELVKQKLMKITQENTNLKMNLNKAETNIKLLESEIVAMKYENNEKLLEYQRNEHDVSMVLNEQNNITKQVETLSASNRQLLDSNDGLREALENALRKSSKRSLEYIQQSHREFGSGRSSQASMESESLAQCDPGLQLRLNDDEMPLNGYGYNPRSQHMKDILNSISDSGVGTFADEYMDTDDWEPGFNKGHPSGSQSCRASFRKRGRKLGASFRSDRPYIIDRTHETPHGSITPHSDDEIPINSLNENGLRWSTKSHQSSTSSLQRKVLSPDITLGHNDKIYKVVLCGDAGVGKSSFIFRLCRDKFKRHTTSTLGVDFQMKTIELEHDQSVSLQLWDTAGQERFRSISAQYFRKAQGALLLYDCTMPQSFINIRDWMETLIAEIPSGSPVIIIGNKTDLREKFALANRQVVTAKEGAQLAANYGVLFMETSAADGSNILTAVTMLARHLNFSENLEEDDTLKTLKIEEPDAKKNCCLQS